MDLDYLRPFLVDSSNIRGKIIRSNIKLSEMVVNHNYPEQISKILFESMLVVNLFAGDLKKNGIITIQATGNPEILKFLVVDATDNLNIRGYCDIVADNITQDITFTDIFGNGTLIVTIDMGEGYERYQGVTQLAGNSIAEAMTNFIINSEQLPTIIKIASKFDAHAQQWIGTALMVQYLPGHEKFRAEGVDDNWQEIEIFTNTLHDSELLNSKIEDKDLLTKLYSEHDIVLFDKKPISNKCRCSHLRALKVLKSLPQEELEDLKVDGKIVVKCQFCLKESFFSEQDI